MGRIDRRRGNRAQGLSRMSDNLTASWLSESQKHQAQRPTNWVHNDRVT